MSIYATDSDPTNCPICNAELHSNNTKRIGNKAVCKDCQFKMIETWNRTGDNMLMYILSAKAKFPEATLEVLVQDYEIVNWI